MKDIISRKDRVVEELVGGIDYLLKNRDVTIVKGRGEVVEKNKIVVKENNVETTIVVQNIILATGGKVSKLNLPGIDLKEVMTSTDAFYKEFQKEYGICNEEIEIDEKTHLYEISTLYEKYSHWDFRYGDSPNWEFEGDRKFSWGKVSFGLAIEGGKIAQIGLYSDSMESTLSQCVKDNLYSIKLNDFTDEFCEILENKSLTRKEKEVYRWIFEEIKDLKK